MFDFSGPGEHVIAVWTDMTGDEDHSNDTTFYYITNRIEVPYTQNFENWDGAWYVDTISTNSTWEFGTPDKLAIPGAASGMNAWVTSLTGSYNPLEQSYLTSPCFDFSAVTQLPVIEFSLATESETDFDGSFLEMTKDDGATWTKIGALGEGYNWYNSVNNFGTNGDVWSGSTNGW